MTPPPNWPQQQQQQQSQQQDQQRSNMHQHLLQQQRLQMQQQYLMQQQHVQGPFSNDASLMMHTQTQPHHSFSSSNLTPLQQLQMQQQQQQFMQQQQQIFQQHQQHIHHSQHSQQHHVNSHSQKQQTPGATSNTPAGFNAISKSALLYSQPSPHVTSAYLPSSSYYSSTGAPQNIISTTPAVSSSNVTGRSFSQTAGQSKLSQQPASTSVPSQITRPDATPKVLSAADSNENPAPIILASSHENMHPIYSCTSNRGQKYPDPMRLKIRPRLWLKSSSLNGPVPSDDSFESVETRFKRYVLTKSFQGKFSLSMLRMGLGDFELFGDVHVEDLLFMPKKIEDVITRPRVREALRANHLRVLSQLLMQRIEKEQITNKSFIRILDVFDETFGFDAEGASIPMDSACLSTRTMIMDAINRFDDNIERLAETRRLVVRALQSNAELSKKLRKRRREALAPLLISPLKENAYARTYTSKKRAPQ